MLLNENDKTKIKINFLVADYLYDYTFIYLYILFNQILVDATLTILGI